MKFFPVGQYLKSRSGLLAVVTGLLKMLRLMVTNTQSFLSLYQGFQHFHLPFVKGFVPFVETSRLLLVAGDPVCPVESRLALLQGMMELASSRHKKLVILPARDDMKEVCLEHGFDAVFIGREPIFDLQNLPKLSKSIRLAVKRVERLGLKFIPYQETYRQQILTLCCKWQNTHEMPAMQFLFQLKPFNEEEHKKLFLALSPQDEVLDFIACSPIFARQGCYVEDLIRIDDTPNGTTELLVTKTLESLAAEGYKMATLAPLADLPDKDESHPGLYSLPRIAYKRLSFIYHFQTLEFFKGRFKPNTWEAN